MEINIEEAEVDDTDLVFNLTKRAFQDYNDPALFPTTPALLETKEEVREDIKNKTVLIAYLNDKPVGSVRFYSSDGKEFHLGRLGVLSKHRGKNIGQRLISAVENKVRSRGGRRVTLYSAARLKDLLEFYKKLGYEIIEMKEDPDYTRAVISKKL